MEILSAGSSGQVFTKNHSIAMEADARLRYRRHCAPKFGPCNATKIENKSSQQLAANKGVYSMRLRSGNCYREIGSG